MADAELPIDSVHRSGQLEHADRTYLIGAQRTWVEEAARWPIAMTRSMACNEGYYWEKVPSSFCHRAMESLPASVPRKVINIGCGEGRNAICVARNGYSVTAFDLADAGVQKTLALAKEARVDVQAFKADLLECRLQEAYDIVYASAVLHLVPPEMRPALFANYREMTSRGGINALNVFVVKAFLDQAPDAEPASLTGMPPIA